jgi:hypothetical protein
MLTLHYILVSVYANDKGDISTRAIPCGLHELLYSNANFTLHFGDRLCIDKGNISTRAVSLRPS